MIKYIHIQNFKSFKNIQLKPANLVLSFGINGMGKSTLLQSLLLLRQSYLKGVLENFNTYLEKFNENLNFHLLSILIAG